MAERVAVSLVWHMHQPEYRDPVTGEAVMPWVRLHAAKDYYDMAALSYEFPALRQVFNLTPVLLEQVESLSSRTEDSFMRVSLRKSEDLSEAERIFAVRSFFMVNWDRKVRTNPRYLELLEKRGTNASMDDLAGAAAQFSAQELRDLTVLFNLAWTGSHFLEKDPVLAGLSAKGRDYTEEDKKAVLEAHWRIAGAVIPQYRELASSGLVELTTTPYYHPISPLLIDQNCAREARPEMRLPARRFEGMRDAEWHMDRAIAQHEKLFGARPAGMWPAEGSVSDAFIALAASRGIKWLATDEGVLAESLAGGGGGDKPSGTPHSEAWLAGEPGHDLAMFFRDRYISDAVGFMYARWNPEDAAGDFIHRVKLIGRGAATKGCPPLVPVILDGENAWETYHNEGKDFLRNLYSRLSTDPELECVTPAEYIRRYPPVKRLRKVVAGSWINHDFGVWIGHEEDHRAWEAVAEARTALLAREKELPREDFEKAWRFLMIAEGSDWCWWYGDEHFTPIAGEFDRLFRENTMQVYLGAGLPVPGYLHSPIKRKGGSAAYSPQTDFMDSVVLDGVVTSYFEWLNAASYDAMMASSDMHRGWMSTRRIFFGLTRKGCIALRIDPMEDQDNNLPEYTEYTIRFVEPVACDIIIKRPPSGTQVLMERPANGQGLYQVSAKAEWKSVVEACLSLSRDGRAPGGPIRFSVLLKDGRNGGTLEQWPAGDVFTVNPHMVDFGKDWVV